MCVCVCVQFLITCNIPFSAMVMVAIAVDRYFSICQPLISALTSRRAWFVTAMLVVFAAAIGVCVALMYSVRHDIPLADDDRKQISSNQSTPIDTISTTVVGHRQSVVSMSSDDELVAAADCPITSLESATVMVGRCDLTDEVFSCYFIWYFQKVYNGLFLACFIAVVVLYVLIYRSVLLRRKRRQRQKNRSMSFITSYSQRPRTSARMARQSVVTVVEESPRVELQPLGTENQEIATNADAAVVQAVRDRKRNRVANLKTASMLFVVTIVFVVSFLPAFLMTVQLIPYNRIIFYMYFANNVANPIIYSFMNHNFRGKFKRMICGGHGHGRLGQNLAPVAE